MVVNTNAEIVGEVEINFRTQSFEPIEVPAPEPLPAPE